MSILFRYLGRQVLGALALTLAGLLLLFAFFDLIAELGDVRAEGYTTALAMVYVILGLPGRIHELLPIAALVGAIFALARLAVNSEFTVMRASGLSIRHLVGYMLVIGLGLGLATLLIGEYVSPPAERFAQQLKIRNTSGIVAQEFRSGLWAKDGGTFINIRQMLPDATLRDVRMYEFDQAFHLQRIVVAESATWSPQLHWSLGNVLETRITPAQTRTERRARVAWRSALTPDLLSALMVNPDRMALTALYDYVTYLKRNRQKATRYEIALWNKLAFPLAAPVMLLLALPFAYRQPRSRGLGQRVLVGILIGLGFYLLNRMFGHIGLLNDWPPVLSALLPLVVFSGATLIALRRAEAH